MAANGSVKKKAAMGGSLGLLLLVARCGYFELQKEVAFYHFAAMEVCLMSSGKPQPWRKYFVDTSDEAAKDQLALTDRERLPKAGEVVVRMDGDGVTATIVTVEDKAYRGSLQGRQFKIDCSPAP